MHPLILFDVVRQRQAEALAAAERHHHRLHHDRPRRPSRRRRIMRWLRHRRARRAAPQQHRAVHVRRQGDRWETLGERIIAGEQVGRELRHFIDHARANSVTPILLDILGDATQPVVVRQRSFGRVLVELDRLRSMPTLPVEDDAA